MKFTKTTPTTEPITLSWPVGLAKRARLLAAAKETSLSKLVADLLQREIQDELPALLADLETSRTERH